MEESLKGISLNSNLFKSGNLGASSETTSRKLVICADIQVLESESSASKVLRIYVYN